MKTYPYPSQSIAEFNRQSKQKDSTGQRDWNLDQFRIAFGEEDPALADAFDAVPMYKEVDLPPGCKDFEEIIRKRSCDFAKPPPPVRPIYKLAGHSMSTPGNLTAIMAHIKTGKSALVGAFIASSFGLKGDTLGVESANPEGFAIIHLDTEQPPTDHDTLLRVALSRVGIRQTPDFLKSVCLTGLDLLPKDRFQLLEYLLAQSESIARRHS